jgi:hypothetical protein
MLYAVSINIDPCLDHECLRVDYLNIVAPSSLVRCRRNWMCEVTRSYVGPVALSRQFK